MGARKCKEPRLSQGVKTVVTVIRKLNTYIRVPVSLTNLSCFEARTLC